MQVAAITIFDLLFLKEIFMNCPNCKVTMVLAEQHGVEIDYCPNCRGAWLDRCKLYRLIEWSSEHEAGGEENGYRIHYRPNDKHRKDHLYQGKKKI
jgi:uncharacterized protein